jgi:hypothetical protein
VTGRLGDQRKQHEAQLTLVEDPAPAAGTFPEEAMPRSAMMAAMPATALPFGAMSLIAREAPAPMAALTLSAMSKHMCRLLCYRHTKDISKHIGVKIYLSYLSERR